MWGLILGGLLPTSFFHHFADNIAHCAALGTLETTYGVYYVFGNHDKGYYGPEFRGYSGQDLVDELEKNRVTVLQPVQKPLPALTGPRDFLSGAALHIHHHIL